MPMRSIHDKQAIAGSWRVALARQGQKWLINRNPAVWGLLTLAQKG